MKNFRRNQQTPLVFLLIKKNLIFGFLSCLYCKIGQFTLIKL